MDLLKQSTATTLLIGPFVDATDGVTAEDALTISQADVRLSSNGGNMAQKHEATGCTHDELGYYTCPLDTTDTATLGVLKVMVSESGALPVWQEYMVVPAAVYDSIVAGSDKLPVDAQEWQSVAITSGSVPAAAAGATGGLALVGSKVDLVDAPNATGVGVIVAAVWAALCSALTTASSIGKLLVDNVNGTITSREASGAAVAAVGTLTIPTAAQNADAVWDEASTGHTDAGKAGAAIWTTIPAIATVLSGITSLAAWLRGLARKDAMDGTAKTELNTGGGAYNETTDSQEALRDRGDASWITATGFEPAGAAATAVGTLNNLSSAQAQTAAQAALQAYHLDHLAPFTGEVIGTPTSTSIPTNLSTYMSANALRGRLMVVVVSGLEGAFGGVTGIITGNTTGTNTTLTISPALSVVPEVGDTFILLNLYQQPMRGTDGAELSGAAATAVGTLNDLSAQETRDAMKLAPTSGDPAAGSIDAHLDAAALEATLTAMKGAGWTDETLVAILTAAQAATAPTVGEIDTQLSGTHGAGTWGGAAGSGSRTVVVTVQTSGGTVYANVPVTMNNQAETGTSYTLLTNSLGQCTFYLTDGDWRAIAAGTNLQSGGATNYTVNGPESVTVTVTAVTVPATTSAANYLLYGYERKVEADAAFGASGVTVKVLSVDSAGQYDAAANACRRIMGTSYATDANGLWSFEIAKTLADRRLKLQFTWTDAGSVVQTEEWQATILASAVNGSDQIAWADLSPTKTR